MCAKQRVPLITANQYSVRIAAAPKMRPGNVLVTSPPETRGATVRGEVSWPQAIWELPATSASQYASSHNVYYV